MGKNLTKRSEDYSKWYNELVIKADLAENSGVRGSMVIKPYGFAIWEKMQAGLDKMFKETGHARFSALYRTYAYWIVQEKNPFYADLAHFVRHPLAIGSMDLDWIPRYMILDHTGAIKLFRAIKADDKEILNYLKNEEYEK